MDGSYNPIVGAPTSYKLLLVGNPVISYNGHNSSHNWWGPLTGRIQNDGLSQHEQLGMPYKAGLSAK